MDKLAKTIQDTRVGAGSLAIFWLAQAGFVFKTTSGKIVYADPYLTDYVQRALPEYGFGFKRIMPKLIDPEEVEADYVVSTHSHQDHLDVDALPGLLRNPRIHFIGSPDCRKHYVDAGMSGDRFTILHKGENLDLGDFSLTGVYADHGELAPEALGCLFDFAGIRVWLVGDTAYRPDQWQELLAAGVDVLLPPINGAFGNLDGTEAAKLAQAAQAKVVIPSHFWMFAMHNGNLGGFLDACKHFAPGVRPLVMTQGECFVYQRR